MVAWVVEYNKIPWKNNLNFHPYRCLLFEYEPYECLRLDILINEEVIIGFRDPHILHIHDITTSSAVTRKLIRVTTIEAINFQLVGINRRFIN